jgi:hypothetical protein
VTVLVCVHAVNAMSGSRSGYARPGTLTVGSVVHSLVLCNVLTYFREYLALTTVQCLRRGLQGVLFSTATNSRHPTTSSGGQTDVFAVAGPSRLLERPPSVPQALWSSLVVEFNQSQLSVIKAICGVKPPAGGADSSKEVNCYYQILCLSV